MNGPSCSTRHSVTLFRLAAIAALLVLGPGCGGKPDAKADGADRAAGAPEGGGPPLVALIRAADWMGSEWGEDAIKLGLRESDMEAGRDYELRISSAQGDLATLPSLIDAAMDARAQVIVTLQDATLQAAVQRAKSVPIVFNLLSDPFAAGAGTSDSSHLPNITGVYSPGFGDPEQSRRVDLIRRVVPKTRRIGILFSPEEQLSVSFKDRMAKAAKAAGLEAVEAPVSQVGDVGNATQSLCGRKVQAIELYGNVAHAGFASLLKAARECKVPVFSPAPFEVMQGAVASIFPDFQEGGVEAGKMVARVLRGESPAGMPFLRLQTTKLIVNTGEAKSAGVAVPAEVVREADSVVGPK
ncbi:MAG TPA: ABC transporter substrate-binding protein [Gemmatimonadales bacterium]|nr:ABC transporter substrate-binding protein [Gemmatimonadales bacterium]